MTVKNISVEIMWERHWHHLPEFRGWRAVVGGRIVGKVYGDGSAWFGDEQVKPGSQPLAAEALVRYVKAGGR